jgi:hypothetical protein
VPESAAGLATWLLEAEVWSPDWQPSPGILAWFVRLLSSLKDGATWVSPGSGHVYRISHDDKEVILLHGDEHDPGHWHDMNRRTIQALGWTMIDKEFWDNYREEDDDENEFGDSGEQLSFAEGISAPEVYPSGFTAERAGDVVEWRYDAAVRGYRFSKFWTDEWTGKQRKLENGALVRKDTASEASVWVQQEMRRWRGGGWKVTPIGTSTQA